MRHSVFLLNLLPATVCASSSVTSVVQVVLDADGAAQAELPNALLRKEPNLLQDGDQGHLTQQPPASSNSPGFNSSSGLWKEIRKRAKVTAVEPFSADAPPAVVYTGQTASASATIFMGTITCFAAIAWTTQSTLKHVKEASWQTLSSGMAMFSAFQLFFMLREVTNLLVSDSMVTEEVSMKGLRREDVSAVARSGAGAVIVSFARFILGHAALQLIFIFSRQRKLAMEIAVSFGSLLVGLLAADAFATWQEMPCWGTAGASFGFVCITVLVLAVLSLLAALLRSKVITSDEQKAECQNSDEIIACLGVSLPFAQFWRLLLAGQLPHYLGVQRSNYNRSETLCLFFVWFKLVCLVVLADKLIAKFQGPAPEGAGRIRSILQKCVQAASAVPLALAFTSAWCCFFWAKWVAYTLLVSDAVIAAGSFLKAEMYVAMLFAMCGFAVSYGILRACEKWPQMAAPMKFVSEASSFAMSLCLSSAFQSTCAFSKDPTSSEALQVLDRCLQCQWMCVVLIPVWLLLVRPNASPSSEKAAGAEGDDKAAEGKAPEDGKSGAAAESQPEALQAEQEKQGAESQPAATDEEQY